MFLADILSALLQVQGIAEATSCLPDAPGAASACPASTFHAVTAAFATQGYWVQADMLYYINNTGLYTVAKLIYLLAAVAGIISMAMGFPPKLYLWFFMGPGIFHWLIQDTIPVLGVRWNVGPSTLADPDRQARAQREVWTLAETGLASSGIAARSGTVGTIVDDLGLNGDFFSSSLGKVEVAFLFVWYDAIVSDLVEWAVDWTGVFRLPGAENSVLSDISTALPDVVLRTAGSFGVIGQEDTDRSDDQHWLLTNLKWQIMTDITGAKLNDADVRDAFSTFLASECGEAFRRGIDKARFTAASNAKGANVPDTVFARPVDDITFGGLTISDEYKLVTQNLATESMPTPYSLRMLLTDENHGGFVDAVPYIETEAFLELNVIDTIRCDQYLHLLNHAFRWEAGQIYYQLISGLPAGVSPTTLLYTLFYGWPIRNLEEQGGLFDLGFLANSFSAGSLIGSYTPEGQANFLIDLILIHLYQNEFAIAPPPYAVRKNASAEARFWLEAYQGNTGSRNKWGEVYTWALLIPYVQGVVMYLLAMAYPFVCMLILVPGWHKILFTWMTFWAWVKLWDVGWAVVSVLERSIWAMLGNNSDSVKLFSKVWSMQDYHTVDVNCPQSALLFSAQPPYAVCAPGALPEVVVANASSATNMVEWYNSLKVLDKAMVLGAAMDLDLANSYYIYLMAALYFAVPAVTGQLVLGAKAGAASLATQAISGTAQESGRSVGQGFSSDLHNRGLATNAATQQAAYGAALRNDPNNFAQNALTYGNQSLMAEQEQAAASARNQALGQQSRIASYYPASRRDAVSAGTSLLTAFAYGIDSGMGIAKTLGGAAFAGLGTGSGSGAGAGSGNDPGSLANSAIHQMPPAVAQIASAGRAFADMGINDANRAIQAQYDARQAGQTVLGAQHGFERAGLRDAAGHQRSGAEFNAQMARYRAGIGLANHAAGYVSAQGAQGGVFQPGSKPQGIDEMAITGQGGETLQSLAQFSQPGNPDDGAYFNWAYGLGASLDANYGYDASISRFGLAEVGTELSRSLGLLNSTWATTASTFGSNPSLEAVTQGLNLSTPFYSVSPSGPSYAEPHVGVGTEGMVLAPPPGEPIPERFQRLDRI